MESGKANTAVLILSHVTNRQVEEHFAQVRSECGGTYDVIALCDNTSGVFDGKKADSGYFLFSIGQLAGLRYPGKAPTYTEQMRQSNPYHKDFNFRPGSIELPVLQFFQSHPEYDHYWVVEYDVRYTGSWLDLFSHFADCDADLLGTTLTRYAAIPNWYHWNGLRLLDKPIGKDGYIRGFFPIYRISRRGLELLDRDYRAGVEGHFECLGPTLLHNAGLKIEDIGSDGEFVQRRNINRFYANTPTRKTLWPGTFVFRPAMRRPGKTPNMLWHPVKEVPAWRAVWDRTTEAIRHRRGL